MTIECIAGQWRVRFEQWVDGIEEEAVIASPYVTPEPVEYMADSLSKRGLATHIKLNVLTSLTLDNMLEGTTNPAALVILLDAIPHTRITNLQVLHAKVYVADGSEAIVTSGNLTEKSMFTNYEYGVRITDTALVHHIREDLLQCEQLGSLILRPELECMAQAANGLRELRRRIEREARKPLRDEFRRRMAEAEITLMEIRATGKSTNSIFADTILYLLRKYGPMPTTRLHPLIQQFHPDLCDDSIDRVIKGVHFGKKWKHYVRNAQQYLKRQGRIAFDGRCWYLTGHRVGEAT